MKSLYIIVLNYNNYEDTVECLESLIAMKSKTTNIMIRIVLVDNCSDESCCIKLTEYVNKYPEIKFIQSSSNKGYAGGNNIGIKYARKNKSDFICILNNDVVVNSSFYVDSIKLLENDENIYFVGPAILDYSTKKIQYTGGKINYWFLKNTGIAQGLDYIPSEKKIGCDYVGGACLFFRTEIIDRIGYLPENYFLFWEEAEWCAKASKHGAKNICVLSNSILHKGSATINKSAGIGEMYMERNRIVFSKRNDKCIPRIVFAFSFLCIKAIAKGIFSDRRYFKYLKYYLEGLTAR